MTYFRCMRLQQLSAIEFRRLSPLITAYCLGESTLRELYRTSPVVEEMAREAKNRVIAPEVSAALHEVLSEQYQGLTLHKAVAENLQAFAAGNAVTVTTGHQLCILGGPAFVMYKILSAIRLAQSIQPWVTDKKVVPVFWLASEDHDRDEINHVFFRNRRIEWNTQQTGAVGRFSTDGLSDVLQQVSELATDESSRKYVELFGKILTEHRTLSSATRAWVNECFGEWGVVVLDADDARLKRFFIPAMRRDLLRQTTFSAVTETNTRLKQLGYEPQVNPRQLNLFYLRNQSRVRIETTDDKWHTIDQSMQWSQESILAELQEHPEHFSPNVLMRPLYQETILPNIAYVGGPGELAYWMQLKGVFSQFEIPMPALVLRDAAVVVSEPCLRRLSKLGLSSADLLRPKAELIEQLLGDAKLDFSEEINRLQILYQQLAERMSNVDPTLKATAMAELQRVLSGIEQLQAKTWKAIKTKEEQKLTALNKVWEEVFPEGEWQERRDNLLGLAIANDKELLRALLANFQSPKSTLVIAEV